MTKKERHIQVALGLSSDWIVCVNCHPYAPEQFGEATHIISVCNVPQSVTSRSLKNHLRRFYDSKCLGFKFRCIWMHTHSQIHTCATNRNIQFEALL